MVKNNNHVCKCGCKSIRKYGTTSNETTKHIEQKDIDVRFKFIFMYLKLIDYYNLKG